jgi:FkbM family methyltransferase
MAFARTWKFISRHPLTRRRPLSALARFLRWQITCRLRADVQLTWIDGVRVIARRGMTGFTGNIYCGLHEFADMALLLHILRPGDTFIDVGANVGSYTLLASGVCGASSLAFEPDPHTAQCLRRNLELNGLQSRAMVFETALGDVDGEAEFTIGRDTTNQVVSLPAAETRRVSMRRLDSISGAEAALLMKIDVEGFEEQVLAGAERTLSEASLLAVLSEGQEPSVVERLVRHGFARAYYDPITRELSRTPTNVPESNGLFVRDWSQLRTRVEAAPRRRVLDHEI